MTEETRELARVIRALFDPQSFTLDVTSDATADSFSGAVQVRGTNVVLWAKGTGINTADAEVSLQGCNFESTVDSDWVDLPDSKVVLAANATSYGGAVIACGFGWVRRKFLKKTNSAGTFKTVININR